ncbi:MAG: tRNA uridine-5-carboxymethylaminomethyl(34) synthesis GTPase MnmE [Clostridia bacterium]|nr:tRNA uridine-5-carboxymethylaminomethyl(34) synthesis GTPase MnmE [Clostridia bacterium]
MDTIAAIATASGKGGVAIIRISGDGAHQCLSRVFRKQNMEMRKMYYGGVYDGEVLLDKCLCVKFDAGASFTGEETAEIQCHGGYASARDILEAVLKNGARMAESGEFSKRAFMNGKIDLSQAEAVGDIIEAETKSASRAAARLLSGSLGEMISSFQDVIKELLTAIEAGIDYPDEIDEQETSETIISQVQQMLPQIDKLIEGYSRGRITKEGLKVCIIGKPNAGKSSLLNALCGSDRAIVTSIAGTTRDTLHEILDFSGIKVHLFDTAGIRESDDVIERAGVERSQLTLKDSDVVLCVTDSSEEDDFSWIDKEDVLDKQGVFVFNKSDLNLAAEKPLPFSWERINVSTKTGEGIEAVSEFIASQARANDASDALTITSQRHFDALVKAKGHLENCLELMPPDILSIDLTSAWTVLGEITGQTVTEDIVNNIFEKFCVGK